MSKFESHIRKYSVLGFSSLYIFACSGLSQAKDRDRDRNRDRGDHELRHSVDDRIEKGFAIAPVALDLNGKDRALVGYGSYLVNAGGCNDCHTNPSYALGGDPFLGQPEIINSAVDLAGGRPFGPTLKSANLTPDASGRPAGLTLQELMTTIRTGRDHEDAHILQVMPWPVIRNLIDIDLTAIYEYLKAIPSRPNNF